ncbi:MAG TPA: asparagine synthase (glutamine-hydrolyzing) [Candidatus Kapabacteria bacterium]|nr:asparagine synthase (glutamine-hydrolyzing) [Candidatus Kapabacteria bacterium]
MCGIAGVIDNRTTSQTNHNLLKRMSDVIVHRGPDSDGQWLSDDLKCGFSFRRLAIIDLSENGNQPMHTPDGRYHIVFNGEIYNHKEIRKELLSKGYNYHSNTDTETILYGYQEWGTKLFNKLLGMWAIAIWDSKDNSILLCRDRIGIKPLYYYLKDNILVFGSEIKSILQHPDIKATVNYREMVNLLHFSMTGTEGTLFEGIKKLPSGHFLVSYKSDITITQYWTPLSNVQNIQSQDENQIISNILAHLRTAIKDRMMSDVPFGVFLSGGIDSSLNVALMSEIMDRPVDTYTVGFSDLEKYNELYYANLIAKKFKSNHHEILINKNDAFDSLDDLTWHTDEPNGDPVCIPLYYLSKLTKNSGTTVIQVGEGSDEQFFGYDWIIRDWKFNNSYHKYFNLLPQLLKQLVFSSVSPLLNKNGYYIISEYIRRSTYNEELYKTGSNRFTPIHLNYLLNNKYKNLINEPNLMINKIYDEISRNYPQADQMQKMVYIELRHRLAETLLMRVDKITMAHSLEARVPFLDSRLVEYTMSLNEKQRLPNTKIPKYLLKKAAENILPNEVIYRKKQGFAAPVKEWLRNEWFNPVYDIINQSFFVTENIFDINYINRLFKLHKDNKFNFQNEIYILLMISLWHKKFIK